MDRRYFDYKRLCKIHTSDAFYATRAKDNMGFRSVYSTPKDTLSGIVYDQIIMLINYTALKNYQKKIRRIKIRT